MVDATGETKDDTFTFTGTPHSRGIELPVVAADATES